MLRRRPCSRVIGVVLAAIVTLAGAAGPAAADPAAPGGFNGGDDGDPGGGEGTPDPVVDASSVDGSVAVPAPEVDE